MLKTGNMADNKAALASIICKSFDKKTGSGVSVNQNLAEELYKEVIKKFNRQRTYVRF